MSTTYNELMTKEQDEWVNHNDELINVLYWTANRSMFPSDWNQDIYNRLALVNENDYD